MKFAKETREKLVNSRIARDNETFASTSEQDEVERKLADLRKEHESVKDEIRSIRHSI